jgi:hypothetical protein
MGGGSGPLAGRRIADGRVCLHCALARLLRAEAAAFAERNIEITVRLCDPAWVPGTGVHVYRLLRRLVQDARDQAGEGPVKLAILNVAGKSHVEVTATIRTPDGARVLGCTFPRYRVSALAGGFAEGALGG